MGRIINSLFEWSVEDLRQEFCLLEYADSKLMSLRVSQVKDKFNEINIMMDKQLEVNKQWDKKAQKSTKPSKRKEA